MNEKSDEKKNLRSPIITVVGHIDHGKTTFINYVGKISEPDVEYGGITQHVKCYNFETKFGNMTFLDTPGHFAFNSLRENSIKYSDIVLLIIAADDGIKPQTIESINLAKRFAIPIIVVINKVDKIDNFNKLKFLENSKTVIDLANYGLVLEKWGGDTIITCISAKTGDGIDELLELVKLQADILSLTINQNEPFYGIVLDNKIQLGLGFVTTLILKNGFLKPNNYIKINSYSWRIKSIFDLDGKKIENAIPSLPINVTGLDNSINIGEIFFVDNNYKDIKKNYGKKTTSVKTDNNYDLDYLMKNINKTNKINLNLIIRADVQGSLNVLKNTIINFSTQKVNIVLVKCEIGSFNDSDIDLGITTNSILIGFNIKISSKIKKCILNNNLKFGLFNVIYELTDFIKVEIEKLENISSNENVSGIADVKKIFKNDSCSIAGCYISYGKVKTKVHVKVIRKNNTVYQGNIECIKVFKNLVNEVKIGNECGIKIKDYNDLQINDKIYCY